MKLSKTSISTALYTVVLVIQIIICVLAASTNRFNLYHILNLAFAIALVYKSFEIDYLKSEKKKGARRED